MKKVADTPLELYGDYVKKLCLKICGRIRDLTVADLAKIFPERASKTINNDVCAGRLLCSGRSGRKLLFTWKEVTFYGDFLGKWRLAA